MLTDDTVQQMCQSVSEVLAMETALRILAAHGYAVVSKEPAEAAIDKILEYTSECNAGETPNAYARRVYRDVIAAAQETEE